MSNDLEKTSPDMGYRLIKADISSLKDTITERFDRVDKRLDEHREFDRELQGQMRDNAKRIEALELKEARQEGSNFADRLGGLAKKHAELVAKVEDLNAFRWKLVGVATGMAALAGGGAALAVKLLGG